MTKIHDQLLEVEACLISSPDVTPDATPASTPDATPASTPDEEQCLTAVPHKLKVRERTKTTPNVKDSTKDKKTRWFALVWRFTPLCMVVISIVQLLMYLLTDTSLQRQLRWDPVHRDQPYRLLTYTLLHRGATHLALNVLLQLLLAAPLGHEQDGMRTTAVYAAGGVAGALGAALVQPQPLVGASAGVYAVLMSHLSHLYLNISTLQYRSYRVFCVLVLAASDAALCAVHARTARISVGAHGAGGVAGALVALAVFRGNDEPRRRLVRAAAALTAVVLFVAAGIALAMLPRGYFTS